MLGARRIDRRWRILHDRVDEMNGGRLHAGVPTVDLGGDDRDVARAFDGRRERDPALAAEHELSSSVEGVPRFRRTLSREVLPMAKVELTTRGQLKSSSIRSTEAAFLDGHEMAYAARGDRPFEPAIGPQVSVLPGDAGDQNHFAADGHDGFTRLDQNGHVVPRQPVQRVVEIPQIRRIGVARRWRRRRRRR